MKFLTDTCPLCGSRLKEFSKKWCLEPQCYHAFAVSEDSYQFRVDYDLHGPDVKSYDIVCSAKDQTITIERALTDDVVIVKMYYPPENINQVISIVHKTKRHASFK